MKYKQHTLKYVGYIPSMLQVFKKTAVYTIMYHTFFLTQTTRSSLSMPDYLLDAGVIYEVRYNPRYRKGPHRQVSPHGLRPLSSR